MESDFEARQKASEDLNATVFVEAGAGTGKTAVLVKRILSLIGSGLATVERIVAITFTEKAAGELKLRLRRELEAASQKEETHLRQRFGQALADLSRAPIGTIHSFCASLIRERPVEARVDPAFVVADETTASLLRQKAWQQWLEEQMVSQPSPLADLLKQGMTLEQLAQMGQLLLLQRNLLASVPLPEPVPLDFESLWQKLLTLAQEMPEFIAHCLDPQDQGWQSWQKLHQEIRFLQGLEPTVRLRYAARNLEIPIGGNQEHWRPKTVLQEIKSRLRELRNEVESFQGRFLHNLTREAVLGLQGYLQIYRRAKDRELLVDFEDLLSRARNLLRNDKAARAEFQSRYRYLLVDEFQDTDPLQAQVLFFLAENGAQALDWQSACLTPGKLFVVGDPKQSVYRFRRADIEIYEEVKDLLGPAAFLTITQNFRSRPRLIDWFNRAFAPLIRRPADGRYQPDYIPLCAARAEDQKAPALVFLPPTPEEGPGLAQARRLERLEREADALAQAILTLVQEACPVLENDTWRPVAYRDMAILLRRFTYIAVLEEALTRAQIPYRVIGARSYYRRLEIKCFSALLSALDNPHDFLATLTLLRSPIFSLSDEDIFQYVHHHGTLDYRRPGEGPSSVRRVFEVLDDLHQQRHRYSPARFIEECLEKTGCWLTFFSMEHGPQKLANLRKVIEQARAMETHGLRSFSEFVAWFSELERLEEEESDCFLEEEGENQVRLFTIHRAKGLEFPVVLLADIGFAPARPPQLLVHRENHSLEFKLPGRVSLQTLGYAEAAGQEKQRLEAEEKRLLYVAVTRARDYLVIPLFSRDSGYLAMLSETVLPAPDAQETPGCRLLRTVPLTRRSADFPTPVGEELAPQEIVSQWQSWQTEIADLLRRAADTPPNVAQWLQQQLPFGETTEGTAIGVVVHRVLAHLELELTIDMFTASVCEPLVLHEAFAHHLSPQATQHTQRMVECVIHSSLWQRIRRGKPCWRELPFILEVEGVFVEGTIDVLFTEGSQLVIVDYQSDCLAAESSAERMPHHRLAVYALAAQEITGQKVKEVVVFFLWPKITRTIPVTPALLEEAKKAMVSRQ